MNYQPPGRIKISSDGNEIEYVEMLPKNKNQKEDLYKYVFEVSKYKKGMVVTFTQKELQYNLNNFFKIIK